MIFHSFTVSNYRSIKEPLTITMEAADVKGSSAEVDERNLFIGPDGNYLLVKAIYGANAAGKSNIFKALIAFRIIITEIGSASFSLSKYIQPFKLNGEANKQNTLFEIVVSDNDIVYRYGFEANTLYVAKEWLFITGIDGKEEPAIQNTYWDDEAQINPKYFGNWNKKNHSHRAEKNQEQQLFSKSNSDEDETREFLYGEIPPSTLLLVELYKDFEEIANIVLNLSVYSILTFNALSPLGLKKPEIQRITTEGATKAFIRNMLRYGDVNIIDFDKQPVIGEEGEDFHTLIVKKVVYDESGHKIGEATFNLNQESDGTKKLFAIARVLELALSTGYLLFVDELDARFHPHLTSMIVELFQNPECNLHGAQLIFITHDTQFLTLKRFRPDQISFVSRNKANATEISTLIEYEGVESESDIAALYNKGLLEGVPNLNLFLESFKVN